MQLDGIITSLVSQITPQLGIENGRYLFCLEYGVEAPIQDQTGIHTRSLQVRGLVITENEESTSGTQLSFPDGQLVYTITVD